MSLGPKESVFTAYINPLLNAHPSVLKSQIKEKGQLFIFHITVSHNLS